MGRIEEAQEILKALGLPDAQQNEISALTLLALVDVGPKTAWSAARKHRSTVTKTIMTFIAEKYGKTYAPNTRETVRRQVLHQFMQARVVDYNPYEPDLPTNSPRAHYAISDGALAAIQTFGTSNWPIAYAKFITDHGSLAVIYAKHKSQGQLVPITLPDGTQIDLSPGHHNELQKAIIEKFGPRFAPGADVLYIGDTAQKNVIMDLQAFEALGLKVNDHDKLPDVVLFDAKRGWLFHIEAVTSHGPMSPKRVFELQALFKGAKVGAVYVTAFLDMAEFRKNMKDIAWETEVWIAELPDHMIHFNGDRFLGPR